MKDNSALKISVVTFASLNTSNYSEEGTIKDANVLCSLTNDATKITNSLTNIPQNGPRTNLEAGLELAYKQFSNEKNNKYIIVLTDGIPTFHFLNLQQQQKINNYIQIIQLIEQKTN